MILGIKVLGRSTWGSKHSVGSVWNTFQLNRMGGVVSQQMPKDPVPGQWTDCTQLFSPEATTRPPAVPTCCASLPGVSKIVTVDVKGNSPLWLKVKDLAEGMTYRFRIRAKTFTYGPEIEANVTTGPGEGRGARGGRGGCCPPHSIQPPKSEGVVQSRARSQEMQRQGRWGLVGTADT